VSTLSELVGEHTDLTPADIDRLHSLVADWAMLADLSFADLLLCVQIASGGADRSSDDFLVVAQVRPATGPTVYAEDMVAQTLGRWTLSTARREGRIVREGDPEWERGVPVRVEAVPVRSAGQVVAVLARDTNLSATRSPSALELAYLRTAGDLVQMVAEGTFPFEAGFAESAEAPRVGDGMMRLDGDGVIAYASPNAVSAYRRLGHNGNLAGESLAEVHQKLIGPVRLSAPATPAAELPAGLRFREAMRRRVPIDDEIEQAGAVVLLRAIPLMPGAERGTLVLARDATELRRREAQLLSKDATIREIHHRVKNNLQTVAALLRLQARRMVVPEARLALRESVRRVTSIALVHETLSQSMGEEVDFDAVADQLAAMTVDVAATGSRATVHREGSFGILPGALATPLALVLSELMQNAVEHGAAPSIRLAVARHGQQLDMVVADDGRGLPADFSLEKPHGLGLQIVRTLVVGEMRGTLAFRPAPHGGTEAAVSIPEITGTVS
jgi:two-component system, sensor histidine kinase PdtaS